MSRQPRRQRRSQSKSQQTSTFSVKTSQKKLPYDYTIEELKAHVDAEVKEQIFTKRVPEEKAPIDPAAKNFFKKMSKKKQETTFIRL